MSNPYYNASGNPAQGSSVTSAVMRSEMSAVQAGFDKLPTLSGNANKLVIVNPSETGLSATSSLSGLTYNGLTITSTSGVLTLANSKALTVSNTMTLTATDGATLNIGVGGTLGSAAFTSSGAYVATSSLAAGVAAFLGAPSSANLRAAMTDESGTDALLFQNGDLGDATATTINKVTITTPATSAVLTLANGKTLTASNTLTLTGTDGASVNFGGGGTVLYGGAVTSSSLTMNTSKLLGRTTASSGPIEELSVGTGLVLSGGVLNKQRQEMAPTSVGTGTTFDLTSIPSWAKRVVIHLSAVSFVGTDIPMIRLGDTATPDTTGYVTSGAHTTGAAIATSQDTDAWRLGTTGLAASSYTGDLVLDLVDATNNVWAGAATIAVAGSTVNMAMSFGRKALAGALSTIRLVGSAGGALDGGSMGCIIEG